MRQQSPRQLPAGGSTGNLIAMVDCATGILGPAPTVAAIPVFRGCWSGSTPTPTPGDRLAGVRIPGWLQARATAEQSGPPLLPGLPVLGRDIALAEQGPVIIEANSNPDVIGSQVASGVGARQLLRPLYV
ncbi:MAG: hypothetical protein MZW92_34175 [Comamonadaceae bacterium]|nr:hypothetical protein [Comamonadaceae bacterium]